MSLVKADEYLESLHWLRLLMFMECAPAECDQEIEEPHFHQLIITPDQFKKIGDIIFENPRKDPDLKEGYERGTIELSIQSFDPKPFDGLSTTDED